MPADITGYTYLGDGYCGGPASGGTSAPRVHAWRAEGGALDAAGCAAACTAEGQCTGFMSTMRRKGLSRRLKTLSSGGSFGVGTDTLLPGEQISNTQQLVSADGQSLLKMAGDLILYNPPVVAPSTPGAIWWTGGVGLFGNASTAYAKLQQNGDFEVLVGDAVYWATDTKGRDVAKAVLRNDCSLALLSPAGDVVWASPSYCTDKALPTCYIVSPSQPAQPPPGGKWVEEQPGAGTKIAGHDGETRNLCWARTGPPTPATALPKTPGR